MSWSMSGVMNEWCHARQTTNLSSRADVPRGCTVTPPPFLNPTKKDDAAHEKFRSTSQGEKVMTKGFMSNLLIAAHYS